jgi:hypothetical protein
MLDLGTRYPWLKKLARDVAVALLISLLAILGYDGTVAQPEYARLRAPVAVLGAQSVGALGQTTHLHSLALASDLALAPQTTLSVTSAITPTGFYQPITATTSLTATLATSATAGQLLLLQNSAPVTITLADAGALKLAANAALRQDGMLLLIYDGAAWCELARSEN